MIFLLLSPALHVKIVLNNSKNWGECKMESNGCPKCEKIAKNVYLGGGRFDYVPCIDCRIEQAEQNKDVAIKEWEQLKKKKEQENELSSSKTV